MATETELTLSIDLEADPIAGSLSSAQGPTRVFSGWMALAAALEAFRAELSPGASESSAVDLP